MFAPVPQPPPRTDPSAQPGAAGWPDLAVLVLFTLISRLVAMPSGVMGFDGPEYINALKLDRSFNVPMPGNIGYVLLGRAFTVLGAGPVLAYGLVGTLLSCVAAAYSLLLFRLVVARGLALATAFALMTSALVWYHGVIMQSYIVWLAAMAAIGYHALVHVRSPSWGSLIGAALATGVSTILRPDLVVFGGPLLGAALPLSWGREARGDHRGDAARRHLAYLGAATVICAACCLVWFLTTASILGSIARYLAMVRAKNAWHDTFGVGSKGLVEGLARNGVKYSTFLFWTAHAALPLAAVGAAVYARRARAHARAWLLAGAWAVPSLYFSFTIFMGNAGLVLPALPLVYLAAAAGAAAMAGTRRATVVMALLAAINAAQFTLSPILALTDQRGALLNHMFLGYSLRGLKTHYTYQLEDFGIDRSLKNTARQFVRPEPLPRRPEAPPP